MTMTADHETFGTANSVLAHGLKTVLLPAVSAAVLGATIWFQATTLSPDARIVLIVIVCAMIGWVATRLPDSLVALIAALALVVLGAQPPEALTDTLGSQIVWLLLAAFVIAAVVKEAGLVERLVAPLTRTAPRVLPFFLGTGLAISATAFLLPSTSGRAALLLPVFLGLLSALPDHRLVKPLALLFPTAILLSAGGSLIGAGAHLVAVQAIDATGGPKIGYLDWLRIGAPLAGVSVVLATVLIFAIFVPRDLQHARIAPSAKSGSLTPVQRRILIVLAGLVAFWIAKPVHGLDESIVALCGAVLLLLPPFCARKPKEVFRSVDTELVLYMAATLMLSVAVLDTGADQWLAAGAMKLLPPELATHTGSVVIFMSIIAVISHLAITSRSARAAILVPALALPVAGLGHDATLTILIAVMGTGFCQTLMASAKPVAIFGMHESAGFTQKDLFKLALPLAPIKVTLLVAFALWVWPDQLVKLDPVQPQSPTFAAPSPSLPSGQMHVAIEAPTAPSISQRPTLRPERETAIVRGDTSGARSTLNRAAQRSPIIAQARNDLRVAHRQIKRDLSRLFR
ncbi:transporter [Tateyamaria omphalii]|uniref:SLC13 family permease n=1 Tax=Tateyamaria omphalii TaxID=299262 RepID=UPI001672061D|nr:SLC13 family permease [Tateyamaria omphalii]GGX64595.1 transporter [Tateyamaria omphalii]